VTKKVGLIHPALYWTVLFDSVQQAVNFLVCVCKVDCC